MRTPLTWWQTVLAWTIGAALGWTLINVGTHLYQDHLQVDQWRQEILNQQLQKLQQPPQPRTP